MGEEIVSSTFNARVVRIAKEHLKDVEGARGALRKVVNELSDDLLRNAGGIEVVVFE